MPTIGFGRLVRMIRMVFEILQARIPYVRIHSIIFRKRNGVNFMPLKTRMHNGKKQYAYQVYYTDVFGERKRKHSKWFDTQKECKEKEALFVIKSQENDIYDIKFKDLANEYIEYSSKANTTKTKLDKQMMLRKYCSMLLDRNVNSIKVAYMKQVRDYIDELGLSTSRKNRILGFINSVFKHGIKFYGLKNNPMNIVDRFAKSDEEKIAEMDIYTIDEFNRFLDAIDESHEEFRRFYFLLYWTGMRLNEAMSLTFNDYTRKYINVYRQCVNGQWTGLKTKGSKRRIAIDKDLYSVLDEQYQKYKEYPEFSMDWFIFGGYNQFNQTTVTRIKNEACAKANLKQIRIHDFRHSHASNLIEAGVNMYKISKRLGHSSVTITMDRYGHLIDQDGDEILDAMRKK